MLKMSMPRKISIEGVAVRTGTSLNNHLFISDELEKGFQSLNGKPILKDHQSTVDNSVGKVTNVGFVKESNGESYITMSGFVLEDEKKTIEKIETGIISEVSIGAYAEQMLKESEESDIVIPIGLHFMEVSLTPTPAVKGTSIARASGEVKMNNSKISEEGKYECPECGKEMKSQDALDKHVMTHKEEEKMNDTKNTPAVQTPVKVDYSAELSRVQEELAKAKLEMAQKELETVKSSQVEKSARPVIVQDKKESFSGYVVEKTEDGRMGIRKIGKANPFRGD